ATGAVNLVLNGAELGQYPVGPDRYAITFYAKTGSVLHLQIAAAADSKPVVFRAATATSAAVTRKLSAGKTDSWDRLLQKTYEVQNPEKSIATKDRKKIPRQNWGPRLWIQGQRIAWIQSPFTSHLGKA